MILKHFGHKTIDAPANVRKQHENIRAIVLRSKGAFDGIDLSSNPFNAGNELLLFFVDVGHRLLVYPMGV